MQQIRFAPSVYMDIRTGEPWVFDDLGQLVPGDYALLALAVNSEYDDLDSAMAHELGN